MVDPNDGSFVPASPQDSGQKAYIWQDGSIWTDHIEQPQDATRSTQHGTSPREAERMPRDLVPREPLCKRSTIFDKHDRRIYASRAKLAC